MAARTKAELVVEDTEKMEEPIEVGVTREADVSIPPSVRPGRVYSSFVAAQRELGTSIGRSATNPHFKSRFVDLAKASETILPVLNRHGLALYQEVHIVEGSPVLSTVIAHEDGSYIGPSSYPIVSKDNNDPQKIAASVTYARRNALMAIVGAAPDDDDGNLAAKPAEPTSKEKLLKELQAMKATSEKFKELATKAGVKAEKYADLSEAEAKKMLTAVGSTVVPF